MWSELRKEMYATTDAGDRDNTSGSYTILDRTTQFVHMMILVSGGEWLEPFYIREVVWQR